MMHRLTAAPGIGAGAREPAAARALIKFLWSPATATAITKSGLDLIH